MDLRQLQYVVAVAEEQSFTRAAVRCRVAQSVVSVQVARLERELGVTLFHRTSRSVRTAPAGELLLPHARALTRAAEVARAEVAAYAGAVSGRLRLGIISGDVRGVPPVKRALTTFHRRHPAVEITLQDSGSRTMAEQVRIGDLDLAVVGLHAEQLPPGLVHHLLREDPLVAVVTPDHPLAGRTSTGLGELASHGPFVEMTQRSGIRMQVDAAFQRAGVERTVAFELDAPDAVVRFVALGLGAAIVPAPADGAPSDVAVLSLDDPAARHPIALVHRSPAPSTPSARAFLALLVEDGLGAP